MTDFQQSNLWQRRPFRYQPFMRTPFGLSTSVFIAALAVTGCDERRGLSEQHEQAIEMARPSWSPGEESLAVGACDEAVKARLPAPESFQAEPGWKALPNGGAHQVTVTRTFKALSGNNLVASSYRCTFDSSVQSVTEVLLGSPDDLAG